MFEFISKGGFVMMPLMLCSVISLAVIIERSLFWLKQRNGVFAEEFLKLIERGMEKEAVDKARRAGNSPLIAMLAAAVENKNQEAGIVMELVATKEIIRMKKYLPAMDTIITLAPLLGLFGTIIGMIRSFDVMSIAGLGQPHAVTGGVAEALIATATGIAVAVVTLIPYNFFLNKVEKTVEEMEHYATRLEMILKELKPEALSYHIL